MVDGKKTAIVTGAGRGIGRAIAVSLCKAGYDVVAGYAGNEEAAKETKSLCEQVNGLSKIVLVKGDISLEKTAALLVEKAIELNGRIDVLVNNAGITRDNLLARMSEQEFDDVIDTNLKGAFLLCKSSAKIMMKQRFGRIINISSVVGVHGNAGQSNYSASKAGIIGLTKSIAKELAVRNITANVIAPGMIETDMTDALNEKVKQNIYETIPAKRVGKPEDIANAVMFLADEKSSYVTGQVIGVDGGMGM